MARHIHTEAAVLRRSYFAARSLWLPLLLSHGCGDTDDDALTVPEAAQVAPQTTDPVVAADALCGQTPATLEPKGLLDVGHGEHVDTVVRAGDRVISQAGQRWVLWDAEAKKQLANGISSTRAASSRRARVVDIDMVGDLAMTPGAPLRFDLRSARDGNVLATIPIEDQAVNLSGLARDASYAYVASDKQLKIWDRTGRLLNELAGAYVSGLLFIAAEPGALRFGSTTSQTITTLKTDGTTLQTPPHVGVFQRWFLDGTHFVTKDEAKFGVYRADGTLVQQLPLAVVSSDAASRLDVGGDGQFVWTASPQEVRVFRLGSDAPIIRFKGTSTWSRRTSQFAFQLSRTRIRFLDLRGAEPTWLDRDTLSAVRPEVSVDGAGRWAIGANDGMLQVSALATSELPARLGCGRMSGLASAGDVVAVGTDDGRIRLYDVSASPPRRTRTIEAEPVRALGFADHGRYLVLHRSASDPDRFDSSIRVLDASTGNLVHAWQEVFHGGFPPPDPAFQFQAEFVTAARADRIARSLCNPTKKTCAVRVSRVDGTEIFGTPSLSAPSGRGTFALSPDGKRLAVAVLGLDGKTQDVSVYEEGGRTATVENVEQVMWLDDERMLIGQRQRQPGVPSILVTITDALGNSLAALPPTNGFAWRRDDTAEYFSDSTRVIRIADGAEVWSGFSVTGLTPLMNPMSVITKKRVVFASNHKALIDVIP